MAMFDKTHSGKQTCLWFKSLLILLSGLISALLAVWIIGPSYIDVEGINIKVAISPAATGTTELRFPPFGVIEAKTHQGPIKLTLSLEQIKSDSLKTHFNNIPNSKQFLQRLRKGVQDSVFAFAWRQAIIAMLSAFLITIMLWRTSFVKALATALLSTILLATPVLYSVTTYNPRTFNEAEYKGVISMAPVVMEFASNSLTDLESLKENTGKIINNLREAFISADSMLVMSNPENSDNMVKILLVSDLHSNPVGVEYIRSLAKNFQIDFIINAGDLTDLGTIPEAEALADLQTIKIPQLFAAGNHDSPETINIISQYDNCRELNGQTIGILGLSVLGFPDPLASTSAVKSSSEQDDRQLLDGQAVDIESAIKSQGRPDILVVHNPYLGRKLMHLAVLTVSGHNHEANVMQEGDSVFVNPGTTGAAGLRGLYSEEDRGYSAAIAYFIPKNGLLAVDLIEYSPVFRQFSLHRKLIKESRESQSSP